MSESKRAIASRIRKAFFTGSDLGLRETRQIVKDTLKTADYGEFYQELVESESLAKDKGEFVSASFGNTSSGFGFRAGRRERVGYGYSNAFNRAALKSAANDASSVLKGSAKTFKVRKAKQHSARFYDAADPRAGFTVAEKISKINDIEDFIKSLGDDIENVTINYRATAKLIHIITADGQSLYDSRPQAALTISIQVRGENGRRETGYKLTGGPGLAGDVFDRANYESAARAAYAMGHELLKSVPAPAGTMEVVLNKGWSGVLLHEAVGHGLEGDFNRRGISVYSGKVGKKVAGKKVTVIDQGNLAGARGSVHFDDEGTPSKRNVLIKNGVLKGYMQDRQNAGLMGVTPTGNGRRENFTCTPMPRMTNTYFAEGNDNPADIIKTVKYGLYIKEMGGGQVDITSGNFNMNATLAYMIRDGKLCEPVKGATLVGNGLKVIQSITHIGNDLKIEKSAGVCGKNGQQVITGCGQPTIKVNGMTVGGTKKPATSISKGSKK